MGDMLRSMRFAVGVPALLVLLAGACDNVPEAPPHLALYPECPGHPFSIRYYQLSATEDTLAGDTLQALPNAGATSGIPEYHDCQGLGRGNDRAYQTLAGIFAFEALGTLYASGGATPDLRAAAEIVAFDGRYEPLAIELGFNCLYVWPEGEGWTARIFSAGGDPELCTHHLGEWPQTAGHPLEVVAERVPDMLDEDYPPVARWDWNPEDGEHFIGIRCGASWCSVRRPTASKARLPERGPGILPVQASAVAPTLTAARWERARLVRGWYDEQRLAIAASPGKLVRSDAVGTILPHPELGSRTDVADYAGAWKEVARVALDAGVGVGQYETKLGLKVGVNIIEMQQFEAAPTLPGAPSCEPDKEGLFWLARVSMEGREPSLRCVERIIHPDMAAPIAAPGTARWRWYPDDEKTWVTCPKGCCTVN